MKVSGRNMRRKNYQQSLQFLSRPGSIALCRNIFCSRFGNSLINDELQRIYEIKRGVIECKGGEIELSSQED